MTAYNTKVRYRIKVDDITDHSLGVPYDNATYGITSGTWWIDSELSDYALSIGNAERKINISQGGNVSTGNTFSFEVTNYGFIKDVLEKGVFFTGLKLSLWAWDLIDFEKIWTGVIESFTVKEDKVYFKCTDRLKVDKETIGSSDIPIALNRNYNNKLVLKSSGATDIINRDEGLLYKEVKETIIRDVSVDDSYIDILGYSTGDYATAYANDFYNGFIYITTGAGAGETYNINAVDEVSTESLGVVYRFYVEGDLSLIKKYNSSDVKNASLAIVRYERRDYSLSNQGVERVHTSTVLDNEKSLTVYGDYEYPLTSPADYTDYTTASGEQIVQLKNIQKDEKIYTTSSEYISGLDIVITEVGIDYIGKRYDIKAAASISKEYMQEIVNKKNMGFECYINTGYVTLHDFFTGEPTPPDTNDVLTGFNAKIQMLYPWNVSVDGFTNIFDLEESIGIGYQGLANNLKSGNDLIIDMQEYVGRFLDRFALSHIDDKSTTNITNIVFDFSIIVENTFFTQEPTSISIDQLRYIYKKDLSIDRLSVGCSGENVGTGKEYETPCETIKYLQTQYLGVSILDIDTTSYANADAEFEQYPSLSARNACHQVVDQNDAIQLIKDLLYAHHLGMYVSRDGKFTIANWLHKSRALGSTATPNYSYSDHNCIDISDIRRDSLNNIVSDIELEYDYNEATGEYQKKMRIKNTSDTDTFSLENSTEGVTLLEEGAARTAWNSLSRGWKRARKESQKKISTKWIKALNSDGTNSGEAIAFIRHLSAHINRQHEYITIKVPYNSANFDVELLSFISVKDLKVTDDVDRNGWVVGVKHDTKKYTIELTVLLDIISTDPFLTDINILQDISSGTNIIQDISSGTDIIQDGDGE